MAPEKTQRDPKEAELLGRAHRLWMPRVAALSDSGRMDSLDDITDDEAMTAFVGIIYAEWFRTRTWSPDNGGRCGWCVRANGNSQAAWEAAEWFDDHEAITSHTMACEHNPLVRELTEISMALDSEVLRDRYEPKWLPVEEDEDEVDEQGRRASRPHTRVEMVSDMLGEIVACEQADEDRYDSRAVAMNHIMEFEEAQAGGRSPEGGYEGLLSRLKEVLGG